MSLPASPRRRPTSRSHRAVVVVALANYLVLALGIPLPAAAPVVKPGSDATPFPCQAHRCGCVSAESCWKSCCCFSHEEKLAWARLNGVTPPAYVIAAAEARPAHTRSPVKKACCSSVPRAGAKSCCSAGPEPKAAVSCCETATHGETAATPAPAAKVAWVSYIDVRRCRGESAPEWCNVPISVGPPPAPALLSTVEVVRPIAAAPALQWPSAVDIPPDPPPRIA
ncbi:MAG: hypothetical protein JNL96_28150 [Planctomycetaceae bacterium]|nr:hypothetical protein [Planctomycetaceae bacterium]